MCGICGVVYFDRGRKADPGVLHAMCDTIIHRGPDDEGQILFGPAGLGMRRLSIIDLVTGHQPLVNEDGKVTIVFNGEIYNFQDIRPELQAAGHRFQTVSDTETILHGYETWGDEVPKKLNGMFGFAIWDDRQHRLLLARDRLGVKPLYYYVDSEKLVFGSELKAILAHPNIDKTLDWEALDQYLAFEYIPAPRSIFKHIKKLEPGHTLSWRDGKIEIKSYWTLNPHPREWAEAEAAERMRELLRDSVRLRLISDVPLGAFLSGGIDSSITVALMAGLMDQPVKTFSIGFKESSYNELGFARAVAERYRTEHHEFLIEAKALDLTEKLIHHLDEPLGDFSIFPTYLVSQAARTKVTVALSGDGGDELFAGYDTYRAHRFDRRFYHRLPRIVKHGLIEPAARMLPPTEKKKGAVNSFKRFVEGAALPKGMGHNRWMLFLQPGARRALFSETLWDAVREHDPLYGIRRHAEAAAGCDELTTSQYVDVKTYLVDDILVKVDRMSMAVSLEARTPFLDYRFVEFAFSLPPELKMRKLATKYLLKKAFWNDLPEAVQNRGKQGFSIPIKNWIRGDLKPMMTDLLAEDRLKRQGLFNPAEVSRLVSRHLDGKENHSHILWAMMVFQQWHATYVE